MPLTQRAFASFKRELLKVLVAVLQEHLGVEKRRLDVAVPCEITSNVELRVRPQQVRLEEVLEHMREKWRPHARTSGRTRRMCFYPIAPTRQETRRRLGARGSAAFSELVCSCYVAPARGCRR